MEQRAQKSSTPGQPESWESLPAKGPNWEAIQRTRRLLRPTPEAPPPLDLPGASLKNEAAPAPIAEAQTPAISHQAPSAEPPAAPNPTDGVVQPEHASIEPPQSQGSASSSETPDAATPPSLDEMRRRISGAGK